MEGNNKEGNGLSMDGIRKISEELRRIQETLSEAVRATGLAPGVGFRSVQIIANDREGYEYGVFFGIRVDLGKIPYSLEPSDSKERDGSNITAP